MLPRRQDSTMKRAAGGRSGSVINFRTTVNSGSGRRSSAVLPSVLTFLVIVASGGLLLMIEKGMLNSMETPPPMGDGRRLDLIRQAGKRSPAAVDVESQVVYATHPLITVQGFHNGSVLTRGNWLEKHVSHA